MRFITVFLLSVALAAGSAWGQLKTLVEIPEGETVLEIDNESETVTIQTGVGFPPDYAKTEAQRTVWAISEARANAVVNAALALSKVNVTSRSQLDKLKLTKREIEAAFEYVLRGAQEFRIGRDSRSGAYIAQILLPLTGPNGVNQAIIPQLRKPLAEAPPPPSDYYYPRPSDPSWQEVQPEIRVPKPVEKKPEVEEPSPAVMPSPEDFSTYTGLIVDARGLGMQTAFAPQILSANGRVVYDLRKAPLADAKGMVGYTKNPDSSSIRDRVGSNPLVISAVKAQEDVDVVVAAEDAGRIMHVDQHKNILAECRVVFVLD